MAELKIYKTYQYLRDPLMKEVLDEIDRRGYADRAVSDISDVSSSTLRNWRNEKTRRPLISSLRATARALGMDLILANASEMSLFKARVQKRTKELASKKAAKGHGTRSQKTKKRKTG